MGEEQFRQYVHRQEADSGIADIAEARKQAFRDSANIAENFGSNSKWGSEYELACIQIAEALRREAEK